MFLQMMEEGVQEEKKRAFSGKKLLVAAEKKTNLDLFELNCQRARLLPHRHSFSMHESALNRN